MPTPTRAVGALLLSTCLALPAAAKGPGHANVHYPDARQLSAEAPVNFGGFGRLFAVMTPSTDGLLAHPSPRYDLRRLGREMFRDGGADAPSQMPVGYVFLGQFIDHDLTLDTVSSFDEIIPTGALENARTVDLDLDCVYGGGPERSPYLYDGARLRVGAVTVDDPNPAYRRHDLARMAVAGGNPTALIGDPRNDENFAVAQIQSAFIAYHNRMVDRLLEEQAANARELVELAAASGDAAPGAIRYASLAEDDKFPTIALKAVQRVLIDNYGAQSASPADEVAGTITPEVIERSLDAAATAEILEEARALTIHHYHRVIAEDFLPRIIGIARVRDMLVSGRDFYLPQGTRTADGNYEMPYIPIEFAVAGYRFGHSQVPGTVSLRTEGETSVSAALFARDAGAGTVLAPRGFTPIRFGEGAGPSGNLAIDWSHVVDIDGGRDPQRANRLDTTLASPLDVLDEVDVVGPGGMGNLAARNLSRGRTYLLPSGQDLARLVVDRLSARGVLTEIYPSDGAAEPADYVLPADAVTRRTLGLPSTPLWYYILQEAERFGHPLPGATDTAGAAAGQSDAAEGGDDPAIAIPQAVQFYAEADGERAAGGAATTVADAAPDALGATLGPVGATIVGETLLGLIDHYRETTGHGIDLNVDFDYQTLSQSGPFDAPPDGLPPMTETLIADIGGEELGRRYLLRNFLHDAGVAAPATQGVVCAGGLATAPDADC